MTNDVVGPASRQRRDQAGAVTAEAAVVLPVLVLFAVGLAWVVALGAAQVRALDAARETARALARGEDSATGLALGRRVATTGARIEVRDEGGTIEVVVDAPVRGPGGLFAFVPAYHVRASAVAAREPGS